MKQRAPVTSTRPPALQRRHEYYYEVRQAARLARRPRAGRRSPVAPGAAGRRGPMRRSTRREIRAARRSTLGGTNPRGPMRRSTRRQLRCGTMADARWHTLARPDAAVDETAAPVRHDSRRSAAQTRAARYGGRPRQLEGQRPVGARGEVQSHLRPQVRDYRLPVAHARLAPPRPLTFSRPKSRTAASRLCARHRSARFSTLVGPPSARACR